eukprot:365630-Chlamydomonas_euryale.AAC.30
MSHTPKHMTITSAACIAALSDALTNGRLTVAAHAGGSRPMAAAVRMSTACLMNNGHAKPACTCACHGTCVGRGVQDHGMRTCGMSTMVLIKETAPKPRLEQGLGAFSMSRLENSLFFWGWGCNGRSVGVRDRACSHCMPALHAHVLSAPRKAACECITHANGEEHAVGC